MLFDCAWIYDEAIELAFIPCTQTWRLSHKLLGRIKCNEKENARSLLKKGRVEGEICAIKLDMDTQFNRLENYILLAFPD